MLSFRALAAVFVVALVAPPKGLAEPSKPHVTLEGWEDVFVGGIAPRDINRACKTEKLSALTITTCTGCRSLDLPTPCIEVQFDDLKARHIAMISSLLPMSDSKQKSLIDRLQANWGRPVSQQNNQMMEQACWQSSDDSATIAIMHYEPSTTDPDKMVPAQHPRATITINSRKLMPCLQ